MKKVSKLLSILLVLVMVVSMLSACGKKEAAEDTTTTTPEATTAPEATAAPTEAAADTAEEPVTISIMGIDWGYGPKQNSTMEQYWEEYFGVTLDVEWVSYTDYSSKLNTLLASGNPDDIPDVVQIMKTDDSFYYPVFAQAVDAGIFKDLKSTLFDGGFVAGNSIMSTWSDKVWENATYNGGIYILPRSTSEVAPNSGIMVRKDLMDQYGFTTEPTTTDELKDWLIGMSQASGLYALDFSTPDLDDFRVKSLAVAFTGVQDWGIDANGNYGYYAFADGYADFLTWMKDLYDAKAIDPEFVLNQTDNSKWKAGKSIAYANTWYNWNQSETNNIFDDSVDASAQAWCLTPVKGPKQYAITVDNYGFGEAVAINANVSDEKLAKIMEVINHTEEDYIDVLLYGVEGMHYDFDADGNRASTDEQKTAKQEGYVGAWNQVFLKTNADQVNNKFVSKGCSQDKIDKATELKAFTEEVAASADLTTKNLNLISATYNTNWSALTADLDDMRARYIMGQITLDDWNAYVDGIVNSADYKAISEEFKAAAANK